MKTPWHLRERHERPILFASMLSRPERTILAAGFVWPCLPVSAPKPPAGRDWLHEIKHDGFRVIARKTGKRVKLYSRPGNDLTYRFPLIVEAMAKLRVRSCIIDGEGVACDEDGLSSFDRIRYRQNDESVFMWAFDLIELDGDDLRLDPLEVRNHSCHHHCENRGGPTV
jgi:bifunctional non-homologous end joining protein LigD